MNLDSDETSWDIRTGVLHRISIPFIWAEWFSLGSHFGKNKKVRIFQNMHVHLSGNTRSQNGFCPKCSNQKGARKHNHVHMHIHMHMHNYTYTNTYTLHGPRPGRPPARHPTRPPLRPGRGPCKVYVSVNVYAYAYV